jgi:hypothetical protein
MQLPYDLRLPCPSMPLRLRNNALPASRISVISTRGFQVSKESRKAGMYTCQVTLGLHGWKACGVQE